MRRPSCAFLGVFLLAQLVVPGQPFVPGIAAGEPDYPRLANYYLHGHVDPSRFAELARWDLVILKTVWTEEELAALRALNPDIKIYLYVCAYSIETPPNPADPWNVMSFNYADTYDLWWYDADGNIASDWPGSHMVNVFSSLPRGTVGSWSRFFETMVRRLVEERPSIDGIFLDNFWKRLSWNQKRLRLDSDCHPTYNPAGCDGVPDADNTLDVRWNAAMATLARNLRTTFDGLEAARGRPLSLLSNSSADYFGSLNGTMYEFFPGGSPPDVGSPHDYAWRGAMFQWPSGYCVAPFRPEPYRVSVINSSWSGTLRQPDRSADFERHKRFTLGSTLLSDGYYSLDRGLAGHGNLWWEPEYDDNGRGKGYLGSPLGPAVSLLTPSGPELLDNPQFLLGLESWRVSLPGVDGDADIVQYRDGALLQLVVRGMTHPAGTAQVSQSGVRLRQGQSYTLQLSAQAVVNTDLEFSFTSDACPNGRCLPDWRFGVRTVRGAHAVSFVSPADATGTLTLTVRSPGLVRLHNVSLRSGSRDLYRRDFEHGVVIVNYTSETRMVPFGETLQRLDIPGSDAFDGSRVTVDFVSPGDALIYLRPLAAGNKATPESPQQHGLATPQRLELHTRADGRRTLLQLSLPRQDVVDLSIFDVRGRLVHARAPQSLSAGTHVLQWDHAGSAGTVARGIYFVRIDTTQGALQRKVLVTR